MMGYKIKVRLADEEIDDLRIQLKDMLKLSKEEYKIKDRSHFQQACEKLYKVMIHTIEIKSGYNIKLHQDVSDPFFWRSAGFRMTSMSDALARMNLLHYYFYEGGVYPNEGLDITYTKLLKYIESIVNRL